MIPAKFNYHKATSLQDAIKLSQELGDDAKFMSGGHSLLPMMKLRFAAPEHVIDISKIEGLSYVKEEDGFLKIGGLTTQAEIERSPVVREKYHIFTDAAKLIADPSVRNVGTIGGNIAHGDAANDQPSLMLALGANLIAEGPDGRRSIPIDEFFHGFYMTALEPTEILVEVQVPQAKKNSGGAYHKVERKVGDYATAGVAAYLELDDQGVCTRAGVALTNVSAVPLKIEGASEVLEGKVITDELIDQVAEMASQEAEPESDLRGSEAYKRAVIKHLTAKMINKALERAKS